MWCILGRALGSQMEIPCRWRKYFMRPFFLAVVIAAGIAMSSSIAVAQNGPYKVLKTAKVGGDGGFDYISADVEGRRLYVPRTGPMGQLTVYNLDTLEPAGTIAKI